MKLKNEFNLLLSEEIFTLFSYTTWKIKFSDYFQLPNGLLTLLQRIHINVLLDGRLELATRGRNNRRRIVRKWIPRDAWIDPRPQNAIFFSLRCIPLYFLEIIQNRGEFID